MRSLFLAILAGLAVSSAACAQDTFKVKVDQPAHGRVTVTPEFQVKVEDNIMSLGASIMEEWRLDGHKLVSDVVYAQPGVKPLKYDVYIPDGAKNLPFFDWKPDQETKDIFAQYGVPYAADMMRFFDEVFYK